MLLRWSWNGIFAITRSIGLSAISAMMGFCTVTDTPTVKATTGWLGASPGSLVTCRRALQQVRSRPVAKIKGVGPIEFTNQFDQSGNGSTLIGGAAEVIRGGSLNFARSSLGEGTSGYFQSCWSCFCLVVSSF
jgi:hypothetical protein